MKVRRLDLGLTQKEAAVKMAVDTDSVRNWEAGRSTVAVRYYPALITFLGYNPLPAADSMGKTVQYESMTRGWSRKRLAQLAGVDEVTVKRLENDTPKMAKRPMALVCRALGLLPSLPRAVVGREDLSQSNRWASPVVPRSGSSVHVRGLIAQ